MRPGRGEDTRNPVASLERVPLSRRASRKRPAQAGAAACWCALEVRAPELARVIGSWPQPALLESGPGFGASGRWSILAARPRLVFEARGQEWSVRSAGRLMRQVEAECGRGSGHVLEALGRLLDRFGLADPTESSEADLPPFQGGLIGYFGYDLAPQLERLPRKAQADSQMPDVRFALYDTAVTVDHVTGDVTLWAHDLLGEGPRSCRRRAERWREAIARACWNEPAALPVRGPRFDALESNFTPAEYLAAVRQALEYIAAGDVFQVNLSQRFSAVARQRVEPLELYLRLKECSPAPFAAFLMWDNLAVASASPEWFYQTRGDSLVTRPIKGTRQRGRDVREDERLIEELCTSPKDRAELTMIVDLERNDLGRVCRYGSVRVVEPLRVESFAQVHHLVATVEGRLQSGRGPIDIVRALFPGGSITGAPKIRAMEIIDELEPTRRGLYTGAIGYFSRGGTSAFNIAIRTMTIEGARASFQVGGGIVAESDPEAELEETLHKGRGLREALFGSEASEPPGAGAVKGRPQ